jgi:hypothetical protein
VYIYTVYKQALCTVGVAGGEVVGGRWELFTVYSLFSYNLY